METKLTAQLLEKQFGESVSKAVEYAYTFKPEYPTAPKKPYLSSKHTSEEAKQYALDLAEYEEKMVAHRKVKEEYNLASSEVDGIIVEYIKEVSGLNRIPEQYRDKLYRKAYEDGHSSVYHEVYLELVELVEIFE